MEPTKVLAVRVTKDSDGQLINGDWLVTCDEHGEIRRCRKRRDACSWAAVHRVHDHNNRIAMVEELPS